MKPALFISTLLCLWAFSAEAQSVPASPGDPPAPPIAAGENFFPHYTVTPLPGGEKVVLTLDNGGQKLDIIVEPVPAKDGGAVSQWVLYQSGGGALYTKKTIILPGPDGGTPVEGISVTRLSAAPASIPRTPAPAPSAHRSTSLYTTPPRKSDDFRLPIRMDKPGFGTGRPRLWLLWDGQKEIQVEPVETKFRDSLWAVPVLGGDLNHLKYLSNIHTDGSVAPRYFFLRKNKDDSITIYGDDNLDKLKAIEKEKGK